MRVHTRLGKLKREVRDRPPPDLIDLVVAVPVGSGVADGLPPGVHLNLNGRVATIVFEGDEADPAVLAALEDRQAPSSLLVINSLLYLYCT